MTRQGTVTHAFVAAFEARHPVAAVDPAFRLARSLWDTGDRKGAAQWLSTLRTELEELASPGTTGSSDGATG